MAKYYAPIKLGPHRSQTPEGFLLVEAVPVCRTGSMIYGPGETPIEDVKGRDYVKIWRKESEVFAPKTLASIVGKPLVNEHPDSDVTPDNWRELAGGHFLNPRRGAGLEDDLLLADLVVTDREFIKLIEDGKTEVSCGYDADYVETGPGEGEQRNIIINHVALVDSGRCGPRCAVGDHAPPRKETKMSSNNWLGRLRAAFYTKDENTMEKLLMEPLSGAPSKDEGEMEKEEGGHTHIHIHGVGGKHDDFKQEVGAGMERPGFDDSEEEMEPKHEERFKKLEDQHKQILDSIAALAKHVGYKAGATDDDEHEDSPKFGSNEEPEESYSEESVEDARHHDKRMKDKEIEGMLEEEAPQGTDDSKGRRHAKDSAYLAESFHETVALAEILAPGVSIPTFDRAANPRNTVMGLCKFRRKVIDLAYHQARTRDLIEAQLRGKEVSALTCPQVRNAFLAAGAAAKFLNNANAGQPVGAQPSYVQAGKGGRVQTLADMNRVNAEMWARKN